MFIAVPKIWTQYSRFNNYHWRPCCIINALLYTMNRAGNSSISYRQYLTFSEWRHCYWNTHCVLGTKETSIIWLALNLLRADSTGRSFKAAYSRFVCRQTRFTQNQVFSVSKNYEAVWETRSWTPKILYLVKSLSSFFASKVSTPLPPYIKMYPSK